MASVYNHLLFNILYRYFCSGFVQLIYIRNSYPYSILLLSSYPYPQLTANQRYIRFQSDINAYNRLPPDEYWVSIYSV